MAKAAIEPIVGRYVSVPIQGEDCRIYFEQAGEGIPLLCLHTAGADSRQFRHLMCDEAVTRDYRVVAFDLPWHGKSYPPAGWQASEYRLTTQRYVATIRAVCAALELDRPVLMGCSIGGRIVLQLAHAHGEEFRALIGLEAADYQQPWYDTEWLHRGDVHGGEVCAALVSGLIAPQSPDEHRHETLWQYMQSGPGVFKGDLYFYRVDADLPALSVDRGVRLFLHTRRHDAHGRGDSRHESDHNARGGALPDEREPGAVPPLHPARSG
jgi:pimeloyl-ACP methyl ester carboxylesterase